jgi:hypothetical protein
MNASLPALVAEILVELPAARGLSTANVMTWSVADQPFASLDPEGIEIRLDPPIAEAATRTPDAAASPRGSEWVRFDPSELDGHAVDRLRAWLELAYRRAGG